MLGQKAKETTKVTLTSHQKCVTCFVTVLCSWREKIISLHWFKKPLEYLILHKLSVAEVSIAVNIFL